MKKYISILLVLIMTALFIGCATDETKNEYNIAYVKIVFHNQGDENTTTLQSIQNHDSNYWYNGSYAYCHITGWDYGKNDTIILYLKDGRTMQTSAENVLLMYDPDVEK